ncbi:helix-turn-helix transcriptional regulator [Kitasatospora indigofera]|uniref:helix-turn-helix transcriptional regulator n=1 Tax=Kitasatospora indigofera TaxID=67307 RepID=UPI0033A5D6D9
MPKQEYLKLRAVLEEIDMSRSAFYRMRAKGQAPEMIPLPNGQLRCTRAALDAWWADRRLSAA